MNYIKPYCCTTILIVLMVMFSSCKPQSLKLLSIYNNAQTSNNSPTLSWEKMKCNLYEVWIDDIKMADFPSSQTYYTPFPLSF